MGGITTMTKIIGIPRMIGMTGNWDAKRTRMSRMTGLTRITTIMDKSPWDSNAIIIFFVWFPPRTLYKVETLKKIACPILFVG